MNGHFQLLAKEKVKKVGFSNKSCAETELPTEVSNGGVEHQPGWQCSPGTSQRGEEALPANQCESEGDQRKQAVKHQKHREPRVGSYSFQFYGLQIQPKGSW